MAKFSYRTRGNSTPQEKERVYFTCHPLDFQAYFEPICSDILECQNCAVWYRTELEEKRNALKDESSGMSADGGADAEGSRADYSEEAALDLGQMQLFVIPITEFFLREPSLARDVEFRFALEHHIPILPLMQEPGLESEFNRVCGNLQFLDKTAGASDLTALPYKDKLQKFLSSVLLGDELAAQVRAAFDAYIFLSYRKKDRKYAQELMRLIHENRFCRDVAIWYDEFLTPGENFNDAIRNALEKSNLFAMVVTPNLINEKNYVMTTEYPEAAKKANKKEMAILPAQMVETDRKTLSRLFPGIQNDKVTNAHDGEALRAALAEALADTLPEEKRNRIRDSVMSESESAEDPRHLFFIGLAYLSGIDVETDAERAVRLITLAADAGLEEAIRKLVSMYRNGDGVQRDYEMALRKQNNLVELYRERYEKNQTEEDADRYLREWDQLADSIWELRDIERAKKEYFQMLDLATEMVSKFGSTAGRRDLALIHDKLGKIFRDEQDYEKAREHYNAAFQIREKLVKETGSAESREELCISYDNIGELYPYSATSENCWIWFDKAQECFEAAQRIREELANETKTVKNRRDLLISYDRLAHIYRAHVDPDGMREYYEKGLKICEELARETGTVESRRDLGAYYNNMGEACSYEGDLMIASTYGYLECMAAEAEADGDYELAEEYYAEAEEEYEKCRESVQESIEEERSYYEKGLKICTELVEETGTVWSRRNLSISYELLGDYEKAFQICKELAEETGMPKEYEDLAEACTFFGGHGYKREEMLGRALEIWTKLASKHPSMAKYKEKADMVRKAIKGETSVGRGRKVEFYLV